MGGGEVTISIHTEAQKSTHGLLHVNAQIDRAKTRKVNHYRFVIRAKTKG